MNEKILSTDRPIAIYYALFTNLVFYQKVDATHCTVTLTGDWQLINTTIGTIDFKESAPTSASGLKFITELAAVCPGHNESLLESTWKVNGRRVILKAVYRNGLEKIIGNNMSGPRLYFTINSNNITERRLQVYWEHTSENLLHT